MEGRRLAVGTALLTGTVTAWISAALVAAPSQHRHSYVVWLLLAGGVCLVAGLFALDALRLPHRREPTPDEVGADLARSILVMQEVLRATAREMGATPAENSDAELLRQKPRREL